MNMDPLTRREADKVEGVLRDLVADLELLSYLPNEFSLWLRDDLLIQCEDFQRDIDNGVDDPAQQDADSDENRQRLAQAASFVHAASHYGDAADSVGNEALVQVGEFSKLERDLREHAATLGYVDGDDLIFHHLSVRALLDTLRDGGYSEEMRRYLGFYCPPPAASDEDDGLAVADGKGGAEGGNKKRSGTTSTSTSAAASQAAKKGRGYGGGDRGGRGGMAAASHPGSHSYNSDGVADDSDGSATAGAAAAASDVESAYNVELLRERGMISEGVSHMEQVASILHRLTTLRNRYTVNEDVQRYKVLHEAVNKEQSATADVQSLNREYEEVKAARKRDVAALDETIAQLEDELAYVQRAADVELEAFREVSASIQDEHRQKYAEQLEQHRNAAEVLEAKLRQVQTQHVESTNQLRSGWARREAAVSGAIAEYDTQVSTIHDIVEKLVHETEDDTQQIVSRESQLAKLHKEAREHAWEKEVAEQRQEHLNAIAQRQEQFARVLQAYYRAYSARVRVAKEMEKAGKKKKKKGSPRGGSAKK